MGFVIIAILGALFALLYILLLQGEPLKWIEVEIQQGKLRGYERENINGDKYFAFRSIPYGEPPIGNLRFMAPVAHKGWKGVLSASEDLPICYQYLNVGEEDCLYLNVFTKKVQNDTNTELMPVMFYIHGGGFYEGDAREDVYNSEFLLTENVVLVSASYRLGIFGFMNMGIESGNPITANSGLKDQTLALKWVRDNIATFGGDPNRVTLFGNSAGAISVHMHVLSPLSKGLFHGAIMQSGTALIPFAFGKPGIGEEMSRFFKLTEKDPQKLISQLQQLPREDLLNAQIEIFGVITCHRPNWGSPVIEGAGKGSFLPKSQMELVKSGEYNHVPLMIGYNDNEGILFAKADLGVLKILYNVENNILHTMKYTESQKPIIVERISKFYYDGRTPIPGEDRNIFIDIITDSWFLHGAQQTAKLHSKLDDSVYLYRFSADTELNLFKKKAPSSEREGASHADEIGYLFKTAATPKNLKGSIEEVLVKKMVKLWTNFAKYGNPTPKTNEQSVLNNLDWTNISPNEKDMPCLQIGNQIQMDVNCDLEKYAFWDNLLKEF